MKLFGLNFGKKNLKEDIDLTKRVYGINNGVILFSDTLEHVLSPEKAYLLFEKVAVIFDAVDKNASRVASLTLILKDSKLNVIREGAILELLASPDKLKAKSAFWKDMAISDLLTNELWLVARGNVNRPPLALDFIPPYEVFEQAKSSQEAMPSIIRTQSPKDQRMYYKEVIDGIDRYFSKDGMNELIPIIGMTYKGSWRGLSRLSPLIEEISHIKSGNAHNRGLLENGMTSSSVFSPDGGDIDVTEGEELSDMLKRHHQGAGNAGKPLILPQSFKLIDKSTTNKDMDYMMLIDVDESRVYRLFNIPLPLVKSSTMTQSNYETAIPFLYSDAVLPCFNGIAEEITMKLLGRFKSKDELSFDEFDIPALNAFQVSLMNNLSKTNAVTTNEIRRRGGYESKPNADDIMISAGLVKLNDNGYQA
jgi:HK97 family phage portal protein